MVASGGRRFQALLEVDRTLEFDLLEDLLVAVYRASFRLPSVAYLRNVTAEEVDNLLNEIVSERGPEAAGILYWSAVDEAEVVAMAVRANMVVAVSPGFRRKLSSAGLRALSPRKALGRLTRLSGEDVGTSARQAMGADFLSVGGLPVSNRG